MPWLALKQRLKNIPAKQTNNTMRFFKYTAAIALSLSLFSCGNPDDVAFKEEVKKDSAAKQKQPNVQPITIQKYDKFSEVGGFVGVYQVPEMLTLCYADSAKEEDLAKSFAHGYSVLQADMDLMGIKSDGAPGSIYYNNDPKNFLFECVFPIAKMPKKQPKKSKVVVLEASPMLIYNNYGHYRDLYKAYGLIKTYITDNNLKQSGPLREFYINDPTVVTDSTKWLTRIMVPVEVLKK